MLVLSKQYAILDFFTFSQHDWEFVGHEILFLTAEAMNKTEEESENLHRQLLDSEIDLGTFVPKYKKLRNTYHRRALVHLAAKTSSIG